MAFDYNEGHTTEILRSILVDGVALDGTGLTVTLVLRDRDRGLVPTAGTVGWSDQAGRVATYSPAVGDLRAARSPYTAQWWVTDGNGDTRPAPQGEPEVWKVWA